MKERVKGRMKERVRGTFKWSQRSCSMYGRLLVSYRDRYHQLEHFLLAAATSGHRISAPANWYKLKVVNRLMALRLHGPISVLICMPAPFGRNLVIGWWTRWLRCACDSCELALSGRMMWPVRWRRQPPSHLEFGSGFVRVGAGVRPIESVGLVPW